MTGHGSSAPSKFSDFPLYFQHCKGYNGVLGLSRVQCSDVYPIFVTQQLSFFNHVQSGLVATHLSADHHHHVPSHVMITDPFSGQTFLPIHGLIEVMNEKQQIIIDIWTSSTTNRERKDCAKELMTRFNKCGIDMSTVVIYLDKCCDDSEWLSSLVGLNVLLDNHHHITLYRDSSNATNISRHAQFMCQIAAIVVGKERGYMQLGQNILVSLDKFLIEWQAKECNVPSSSQVIVPNTLACQKT
jgi:hypothetical protein